MIHPQGKQYILYATGIAGMLVSLLVLHRETGLSHRLEATVMLGCGMLSATVFGWHMRKNTIDQEDKNRQDRQYQSGYIAFWTVIWYLFIFVIGGVSSSGNERWISPPVDLFIFISSLLAFSLSVVIFDFIYHSD